MEISSSGANKTVLFSTKIDNLHWLEVNLLLFMTLFPISNVKRIVTLKLNHQIDGNDSNINTLIKCYFLAKRESSAYFRNICLEVMH